MWLVGAAENFAFTGTAAVVSAAAADAGFEEVEVEEEEEPLQKLESQPRDFFPAGAAALEGAGAAGGTAAEDKALPA